MDDVVSERLQVTADDAVLEITERRIEKRRFSEANLLRRKHYLEQSIARFQTALEAVDASLLRIGVAKAKHEARI